MPLTLPRPFQSNPPSQPTQPLPPQPPPISHPPIGNRSRSTSSVSLDSAGRGGVGIGKGSSIRNELGAWWNQNKGDRPSKQRRSSSSVLGSSSSNYDHLSNYNPNLNSYHPPPPPPHHHHPPQSYEPRSTGMTSSRSESSYSRLHHPLQTGAQGSSNSGLGENVGGDDFGWSQPVRPPPPPQQHQHQQQQQQQQQQLPTQTSPHSSAQVPSSPSERAHLHYRDQEGVWDRNSSFQTGQESNIPHTPGATGSGQSQTSLQGAQHTAENSDQELRRREDEDFERALKESERETNERHAALAVQEQQELERAIAESTQHQNQTASTSSFSTPLHNQGSNSPRTDSRLHEQEKADLARTILESKRQAILDAQKQQQSNQLLNTPPHFSGPSSASASRTPFAHLHPQDPFDEQTVSSNNITTPQTKATTLEESEGFIQSRNEKGQLWSEGGAYGWLPPGAGRGGEGAEEQREREMLDLAIRISREEEEERKARVKEQDQEDLARIEANQHREQQPQQQQNTEQRKLDQTRPQDFIAQSTSTERFPVTNPPLLPPRPPVPPSLRTNMSQSSGFNSNDSREIPQSFQTPPTPPMSPRSATRAQWFGAPKSAETSSPPRRQGIFPQAVASRPSGTAPRRPLPPHPPSDINVSTLKSGNPITQPISPSTTQKSELEVGSRGGLSAPSTNENNRQGSPFELPYLVPSESFRDEGIDDDSSFTTAQQQESYPHTAHPGMGRGAVLGLPSSRSSGASFSTMDGDTDGSIGSRSGSVSGGDAYLSPTGSVFTSHDEFNKFGGNNGVGATRAGLQGPRTLSRERESLRIANPDPEEEEDVTQPLKEDVGGGAHPSSLTSPAVSTAAEVERDVQSPAVFEPAHHPISTAVSDEGPGGGTDPSAVEFPPFQSSFAGRSVSLISERTEPDSMTSVTGVHRLSPASGSFSSNFSPAGTGYFLGSDSYSSAGYNRSSQQGDIPTEGASNSVLDQQNDGAMTPRATTMTEEPKELRPTWSTLPSGQDNLKIHSARSVSTEQDNEGSGLVAAEVSDTSMPGTPMKSSPTRPLPIPPSSVTTDSPSAMNKMPNPSSGRLSITPPVLMKGGTTPPSSRRLSNTGLSMASRQATLDQELSVLPLPDPAQDRQESGNQSDMSSRARLDLRNTNEEEGGSQNGGGKLEDDATPSSFTNVVEANAPVTGMEGRGEGDSSEPAVSNSTVTTNEVGVEPRSFGDGIRFGFSGSSLAEGSFPESIELASVEPLESGRGDAIARTTFSVEARTWVSLLRFLMWYGDSVIKASPADIAAEQSRHCDANLTLEFLKDGDGISVIRLLIRLLTPDSPPPSHDITMFQSPFGLSGLVGKGVGVVGESEGAGVGSPSSGGPSATGMAGITSGGKGKGRPSSISFSSRSNPVSNPITMFNLPDHVVLPSRLSSIAVSLYSLRHIAGIALSTQPAREAAGSYHALRSLATCINALAKEHDSKTRNDAVARSNTRKDEERLVDRLRDRLRKMRPGNSGGGSSGSGVGGYGVGGGGGNGGANVSLARHGAGLRRLSHLETIAGPNFTNLSPSTAIPPGFGLSSSLQSSEGGIPSMRPSSSGGEGGGVFLGHRPPPPPSSSQDQGSTRSHVPSGVVKGREVNRNGDRDGGGGGDGSGDVDVNLLLSSQRDLRYMPTLGKV